MDIESAKMIAEGLYEVAHALQWGAILIWLGFIFAAIILAAYHNK